MTYTVATDPIEQSTSPGSFAAGLIAGGIIGAMFALAFAPRAGADLRRSVAGAAKDLGAEASRRFHEVRHGLGDGVEQLAAEAKVAAAGAAKE